MSQWGEALVFQLPVGACRAIPLVESRPFQPIHPASKVLEIVVMDTAGEPAIAIAKAREFVGRPYNDWLSLREEIGRK